MALLDSLIEKFNKIYQHIPLSIDCDEYDTPDAVIAYFMMLSMQTPDVRLQYLAESYDEAFLEFVAAMEFGGDDSYEETVIPRAIKFALNELITEFAGDAKLCEDYVYDLLKFNLLSKELQAFLVQFFVLKRNYSDQDSLSRILEGKDMCAAILILEKNIYITTNSIHSGTITDKNKKGKQKPGQYYTYLTRVMNYFCYGADIAVVTREQIFLEICAQRLAQQSKNPYILSVELRDCIAKELLADHHAWRNRSPNATMEMLKQSKMRPLIRHDVLSVYSILDRVAHDFKKIENKFRGFEHKVLRIGSDKMHAEMKMIDYFIGNLIFSGKGLPKIYIGISKLCCLDCQHCIAALNGVVKTLHSLDNFISYASTSSRRGHGQQFGGWETPLVLSANISSYADLHVRAFCQSLRKAYPPAFKKVEAENPQDMYATDSESEEEVCDEPHAPPPSPSF